MVGAVLGNRKTVKEHCSVRVGIKVSSASVVTVEVFSSLRSGQTCSGIGSHTLSGRCAVAVLINFSAAKYGVSVCVRVSVSCAEGVLVAVGALRNSSDRLSARVTPG